MCLCGYCVLLFDDEANWPITKLPCMQWISGDKWESIQFREKFMPKGKERRGLLCFSLIYLAIKFEFISFFFLTCMSKLEFVNYCLPHKKEFFFFFGLILDYDGWGCWKKSRIMEIRKKSNLIGERYGGKYLPGWRENFEKTITTYNFIILTYFVLYFYIYIF